MEDELIEDVNAVLKRHKKSCGVFVFGAETKHLASFFLGMSLPMAIGVLEMAKSQFIESQVRLNEVSEFDEPGKTSEEPLN